MWFLCAIVLISFPFVSSSLLLSEVLVYPCTFSAHPAALSFHATLNPSIPTVNTVLSIKSTYPFLSVKNRTDCVIQGEIELSISSCKSEEFALTARLDSHQQSDMSWFEFTVMRGLELPAKQIERRVEVTLYWGEDNRNVTAMVALPEFQAPLHRVSNVFFVIDEAVEKEFTALRVFFQPEFSLNDQDLVYLSFPEDFDSNIGNLRKATREMDCRGNVKSECKVTYYAVEALMYAAEMHSLVNFTLMNVIMPKLVSEDLISLYIFRNQDLLAANKSALTVVPRDFNLTCCLENSLCSDDHLHDCYDFGFNIASFSEDMNGVIARFNKKIDVDRFRNCGPKCDNCADFLGEITLAAIGSDPKCRWTKTDEFTISFGNSPTIEHGQITFLAGILRSVATQDWTLTSTRLINPRQLPHPKAVITVTGNIAESGFGLLDCLQTTGSGRRRISCTWSINGNYPIYLDQLPIPFVNKREDFLSAILQVENAWGLNDSSQLSIPINYESSLTISFTFGNFTQFYFTNSILFQSDIFYPDNVALSTIKYDWVFNTSQTTLKCDTRVCSVTKGSFPPGDYCVSLIVAIEGLSKKFKGNASANFRVLSTRERIVVVGANCTVNVNEENIFEGRVLGPGTNELVNLTWSLLDADKRYTDLSNAIGSTFVIPKEYMKPNKRYYIKVKAYDIPRTDLHWIDTTADIISKIKIAPLHKVNPSDIVKIKPIVNEVALENAQHFNCSWSQITTYNFVPMSYADASIFVIAPESLDPGREYTFQYQCTTTLMDERETSSIAQVTIYVNQPPTGGVFTINPTSTAYYYLLNGKNWKDNEGDYPLTYQYCTVEQTDSGEIFYPFTPAVLEANFACILSNTTTMVGQYVCDSLGTCSKTTQAVSVIWLPTVNFQMPMKTFLRDKMDLFGFSNDTRVIFPGLQFISDLLPYLVPNDFSQHDAETIVMQMVPLLNSTIFLIEKQTNEDLSAADQEAILSLIIKVLSLDYTIECLFQNLIEIANRTVSLAHARYETKQIAFNTLSQLQNFLMTSVRLNIPVKETDRSQIVSFGKTIALQMTNMLSPGQFPITHTENYATLYAVRNRSETIHPQEIEMEFIIIIYARTYIVSISPNITDNLGSNRVIDIVILAMSDYSFPNLQLESNMSLCTVSYFTTIRKFNYTATCRDYLVRLPPDVLYVMYPELIFNDVGAYDARTGDISSERTVTAVQLKNGGKFNQTVPIVISNYLDYSFIECLSKNAFGQMVSNVCRLVTNGPLTGVCECKEITGAIIKPRTTLAEALNNLIDLGDIKEFDQFTSGEFNGTTVVIIVVAVFTFNLLRVFRVLDSMDFRAREEAKSRFYEFTHELISELAKHKELIDLKLYATSWTIGTALKWGCFVCARKKTKVKCSVENLFAMMENQEISVDVFASGIQSAFSQMRRISPKWEACDAMHTFLMFLPYEYFKNSCVFLYCQYQHDLVREYVPNPEYSNQSSKWFIDDLTIRQSFWYRFVRNNQILGFFFCRTTLITRTLRIPIIIVNFLGPMASYVANFNNLNDNRMKTVPSLVEDSKGVIWDAPGAQVTICITGIFIAFTFMTEKLVLVFNPCDFHKEKYAPLFPTCQNSARKYVKAVLGIALPIILCMMLLIMVLIKMITFGVNDTYLVMRVTIIGFTGAILVGFHVVALMSVLMENCFALCVSCLRRIARIWCRRKTAQLERRETLDASFARGVLDLDLREKDRTTRKLIKVEAE